MKRLLVFLVAMSGCGQPFDGIDTLAPRTGGGAIVVGNHSYYDGLGEHEHTYLISIALDRDGQVRTRDDLGEVPSPPSATVKPNGARFGDGTRLTIDPYSYDHPGPLVAHRSDGNGVELWRIELPMVYVADFSADDDGTVILGGDPLQPQNGYQSGATVLKLAADGRVVWQTALH